MRAHEAPVQQSDVTVYFASDLLSYKDPAQFSDEALEQELARAHAETEIERAWCAELEPFETDADILKEAESGELVLVRPAVGVLPIQRLVDFSPDRVDPSHEFHYSPPYLRPAARDVLEFIGVAWSNVQADDRDERFIFLPVTSVVRSKQYQRGLTERPGRKIAIDVTGEGSLDSSHEFGFAFDIDATGLYRYDPVQRHVQSINPRTPGFDTDAELVARSRQDLEDILVFLRDKNIVNYLEEVPGTKEWVFHICVNPNADLGLLLA